MNFCEQFCAIIVIALIFFWMNGCLLLVINFTYLFIFVRVAVLLLFVSSNGSSSVAATCIHKQLENFRSNINMVVSPLKKLLAESRLIQFILLKLWTKMVHLTIPW